MSIEMAGGVYCPLSPQDPPQRLQNLIKETQSRLVLIHQLTQEKLKTNQNTLDVEVAVNNGRMVNEIDLDRLSHVKMSGESIAYIIFTSGSTGTPKAVSF